jgi:hypothetical protein
MRRSTFSARSAADRAFPACPASKSNFRKKAKRQREPEAVQPERLQQRNALPQRDDRINKTPLGQELVHVRSRTAEGIHKLKDGVAKQTGESAAGRLREVYPGVQLQRHNELRRSAERRLLRKLSKVLTEARARSRLPRTRGSRRHHP